VDGSTPTASSPAYTGDLVLNDATTIKVAEVSPSGVVGSVATAKLNIVDTTPPKVLAATSPKVLGLVRVRFSERVTRESAENPANFSLSSGTGVSSAKLSRDAQSVELTLAKPLPAGQAETITVTGVKDLSRSGNATAGQAVDVAEKGAVFTSPALEPKVTKTFQVQGLPTRAADAWTLNMFVRTDSQPDDRTLIAGFGRATDGRSGTGRYFAKFARGINFWASNRDVMTNVPLDLGKWQMLTATYDGTTLRVYKNGELIGERQVELSNDQSRVNVMPLDAWERQRKFGGEVRDLTIWDQDLSQTAIMRLWEAGRE
jgi:alpha-mannosidase